MAMYKQDLELCGSPSHPYSITEFDQFSFCEAVFYSSRAFFYIICTFQGVTF